MQVDRGLTKHDLSGTRIQYVGTTPDETQSDLLRHLEFQLNIVGPPGASNHELVLHVIRVLQEALDSRENADVVAMLRRRERVGDVVEMEEMHDADIECLFSTLY